MTTLLFFVLTLAILDCRMHTNVPDSKMCLYVFRSASLTTSFIPCGRRGATSCIPMPKISWTLWKRTAIGTRTWSRSVLPAAARMSLRTRPKNPSSSKWHWRNLTRVRTKIATRRKKKNCKNSSRPVPRIHLNYYSIGLWKFKQEPERNTAAIGDKLVHCFCYFWYRKESLAFQIWWSHTKEAL